ncbi:MAG: sodium:solute symporter, partial [Pirellulaceae bacterium]|nr:sodium:solute symporter [Pirellulaceae bacterium]
CWTCATAWKQPNATATANSIGSEHRDAPRSPSQKLHACRKDTTFWVVLVYGLFINLQNFGIDQSYVQRYITAKTDREAEKSVWLGALLYLPISAVLFFIGTALFAFYATQPELLPTSAGAAVKPDAVFPHFIVTQLPPGATGLLLAAICAAAMSSVDSSLNSSATLMLCDVYKRFFRPGASERESMRVLHVTTLILGVLCTGVALAMIRVETALDAWWKLAGIFSGGMLGLFLLGLISRRAGNAAAVTGVVVGILVILWMTFSPAWTGEWARFASPFHHFMVIVVGTLAIFLVGLLVSGVRTKR